jgi:hypothetical protein
MRFHHYNANPNVAECVKSYLKCNGFTTICYRSYSSGLALKDIWLFDFFKRQLTDYTDRKLLEQEITEKSKKFLNKSTINSRKQRHGIKK